MALIAALITAMTTGCSSSGGSKERGVSAEKVCNNFAHEPSTATALSRIAGTDRFVEIGSKPEETLALLRSANGKVDEVEELQGSPLCSLKTTSKQAVLTIFFREAKAVIKASPEGENIFTFYRTGASALASDRIASIYFYCRMPGHRERTIINGTLERENKIDLSGKELADQQMTVINAAARQVADELQCEKPDLVPGTPAAVSGGAKQ
ncbi:hypothetical protein M3765_11115 [Streptomyces thermoviolaceus]|uniref:hypothetical protein n=1 Tax=Streptomyces thermoviolaceus TaxID=1952 RepID=UPI0020417F7A|nr:hypothetical protein [Streptomyces thermoviolaceus]MCM3264574.1 hypothetical protein [Streptomyces thermoviolaceus]